MKKSKGSSKTGEGPGKKGEAAGGGDPCGACGVALRRLGGETLRTGEAAPVEVAHFECPGCGRRWLRHSERGWSETRVDLRAD